MIPILFAALCVAVAAAESSSISSHSTVPSNMREYEYPSASYPTGKPNYSELGGSYAKSDARLYTTADSSSDSANSNGESRSSSPVLSGSYYKSKYASDTVVNALRPTAFHTGTSSASSPSTSSSSDAQQYPGNEYTSSHHSTSSSNDYPNSYGQREQHHHPYAELQQQQQPEYVGTRPTGTIYGTYAGAEFPPSRPSYSALTGPPASDYHHPHTLAHYPTTPEDYPSPASATAPHYKTYIMSSAPAYPTSKYSTVLGAIKSLFGGGSGGPMLSDAASSATHLSSYSPMGPASSAGYYSPHGLMHPHHVSASSPAGVGVAPPSYYLGAAGLAPSTSAYSKSYAPMRLMSGYGAGGAPGGKVIVVRDSPHLGGGYPATAGLLMASSTSYPVKSKISFGPSSGGYIPSPSPLQGYTSGPPSSAYPASYSSSSSFAHGGSPFLGYSI